MGYRLDLGQAHQITSSGAPQTGALLYVYANTTTTPVALFSDFDTLVSAANPVVADSTGRFPYRFTAAEGPHTYVLKTAAGVTLWSADDIFAYPGDVVTLLANAGAVFATRTAAIAATIPSTVTAIEVLQYAAGTSYAGSRAHYRRDTSAPSHAAYFQSADGAYWVMDEPDAWLKMLGAVDGTGVNSRTAVQNLFALLAAEGASVGRGEIAQYRLDSGVTGTAPVKFIGAGSGSGGGTATNANATVFMVNFTNGDGFAFTTPYGVDLSGLRIEDNTGARASGAGLAIIGSSGVNANSRLTDVSTSGQYDGIRLQDVAYPIIDGGYDQAWKRSAIRCTVVQAIENSFGHIRDRYCFGDTTAGTTQESCIHTEGGYLLVSGGLALGAQYGFRCVLGAGYQAGNITIRDHKAEENDIAGWQFQAGAGAALAMLLIDGGEFANDTTHGNYRAGVRFVDNGSDWLSVFVVSNMRGRPRITRNDSAAFEIETGVDGTICDSEVELMSGSSTTAYGCRVGAQVKRLRIQNVKFKGFTTPYVFSGTDNVLLEDFATGLTVAQVNALATGCIDGSRVLVTNGKKGSVPLTAGSETLIAVLRSGQWECETASGAEVKLNSGTVSAAATLDIPFLASVYGSGFRGFQIELDSMIPATDGAIPWLRTSTNGGSSFDAGANDYEYAAHAIRNDGTVAAQVYDGGLGAAQIALGRTDGGGTGVGNGSDEGFNATLKIMNPTSSALKGRVTYDCVYLDDSAGVGVWRVAGAGYRATAQDTDALRFMFSTGNIASGRWALYGIR
jgi:hypothetical protein